MERSLKTPDIHNPNPRTIDSFLLTHKSIVFDGQEAIIHPTHPTILLAKKIVETKLYQSPRLTGEEKFAILMWYLWQSLPNNETLTSLYGIDYNGFGRIKELRQDKSSLLYTGVIPSTDYLNTACEVIAITKAVRETRNSSIIDQGSYANELDVWLAWRIGNFYTNYSDPNLVDLTVPTILSDINNPDNSSYAPGIRLFGITMDTFESAYGRLVDAGILPMRFAKLRQQRRKLRIEAAIPPEYKISKRKPPLKLISDLTGIPFGTIPKELEELGYTSSSPIQVAKEIREFIDTHGGITAWLQGRISEKELTTALGYKKGAIESALRRHRNEVGIPLLHPNTLNHTIAEVQRAKVYDALTEHPELLTLGRRLRRALKGMFPELSYSQIDRYMQSYAHKEESEQISQQ